jgi:hypothetical protein
MARLIRAHDWASNPIGPIEDWPQALRFAINIALGSSFPTAIYWGPELRLLYNDAWARSPPIATPGRWAGAAPRSGRISGTRRPRDGARARDRQRLLDL